MNKNKLKEILKNHVKWLNNDGERPNLQGANLWEADLRGADLRGADLRGADLRIADLRGADLWVADLRVANLWRAKLRGANLREAKLPDFQICPEEGSFIAWKKLDTGICKLLIPEDAKRTSCLINRKCRASHVKVLEGNGKSETVDSKLEYREGETVYADKFCNDIRLDCSHGIHFFITRKEAEEW